MLINASPPEPTDLIEEYSDNDEQLPSPGDLLPHTGDSNTDSDKPYNYDLPEVAQLGSIPTV
jgi:hypothetical protein